MHLFPYFSITFATDYTHVHIADTYHHWPTPPDPPSFQEQAFSNDDNIFEGSLEENN